MASDEAAGDGAALSVPIEPLPADLYELLQVSPRASLGVIQAAYRVLARSYHPDVNDGPEAVRQMRRLNAAYAILSDPARRARYDAHFSPPAPRRGRGRRPRVARTGQRRPPLALVAQRGATAQTAARIITILLVAALLIGAVLLIWVVLDDSLFRPSAGFRPRAGSPEAWVALAAAARPVGQDGG